MEPIVIILILIGVAFIVGSFFIEEKLSHKEVEEIAKLSEKELKIVVEKQVAAARIQVENHVEEVFDEALEITKRGLERTTNEKIMAVSEYSDTILDSMNKTHNEIMFLYSMLNDKHAELTEFAGSLQQFSRAMKNTQDELLVKLADTAATIEQEAQNVGVINEKEAVSTSVKESKKRGRGRPPKNAAKEPILETQQEVSEDASNSNKNEQIIALHRQGLGNVEIAKHLGCGLGEVKLVLGLFKEE